MKQLNCILIDPFACEVRMIELPHAIDGDQLAPYYAALSHETMPVDIFECVRAQLLMGQDCIFVDEEGLFKNAARAFMHFGWRGPLVGKGLIVGADKDGRARSAESPLHEVQRCTVFLERDGKQWRETKTPWTADETDH